MVILNSGEKITSEMVIKSLSNTVKKHVAIQPLLHKSMTSQGTNHSSSINNECPPSGYDYSHQTSSHSVSIKPLWQVEKNAIEAAILKCHGNIPKAAAMLEVSPSTIYRKKLDW